MATKNVILHDDARIRALSQLDRFMPSGSRIPRIKQSLMGEAHFVATLLSMLEVPSVAITSIVLHYWSMCPESDPHEYSSIITKIRGRIRANPSCDTYDMAATILAYIGNRAQNRTLLFYAAAEIALLCHSRAINKELTERIIFQWQNKIPHVIFAAYLIFTCNSPEELYSVIHASKYTVYSDMYFIRQLMYLRLGKMLCSKYYQLPGYLYETDDAAKIGKHYIRMAEKCIESAAVTDEALYLLEGMYDYGLLRTPAYGVHSMPYETDEGILRIQYMLMDDRACIRKPVR